MTTYQDAEQLKDHWWWRPGWQVGTRFYTWHITIQNVPALRELVRAYKDALAAVSTIDLVPDEWLHITLQGIGHVAEVADSDRDDIVEAARSRLSELPPATMTFDQAVLHAEAVVVPPADPAPLTAVRDAIRQGIADVWGHDRVPESDAIFRPHVSAAYVNTPSDPGPVRHALDQAKVEPVQVTFAEASLIVLNRDHRMYEWDSTVTAQIGRR